MGTAGALDVYEERHRAASLLSTPTSHRRPTPFSAPWLERCRVGTEFRTNEWMNLYRDNNDGTGWHADRLAKQDHEATIPVLSLGATRRFLIRPIAGGNSTVLTLNGGDLVVMGGRCQRDWQHSVPKQKTAAGARISLNFQSRHDVAKDTVGQGRLA